MYLIKSALLSAIILFVLKSIKSQDVSNCKMFDWRGVTGTRIVCKNVYKDDLFLDQSVISKSTDLRIINSHFGNIDENIFKYFPSLINLTIIDSEVQTIDKNAFSNLINLELLDLSYNELYELNENFSDDLMSLNHLNLNDNFIRIIDSYSFSKLINLKSLKLKNNDLRSVDHKMFAKLSNVEIIDLSGNPLIFIRENAFDNCKSLKKLILEITQEELVPESLLSNSSKVEVVFVLSERRVQHRFKHIISERYQIFRINPEENQRPMHVMKLNILSFVVFVLLCVFLLIAVMLRKMQLAHVRKNVEHLGKSR